jgi:stage II sporulation protein D
MVGEYGHPTQNVGALYNVSFGFRHSDLIRTSGIRISDFLFCPGKDAMEPFNARMTRRDLLRAAAVSPVASLPFLQSGCTSSQNKVATPQGIPAVRVLVLENRPKVELSATEPAAVRVGGGPVQRDAVPAGSRVPVLSTHSGWTIGGRSYAAGELTIESAADTAVSVDGRAYRGNYRFLPRANGKFDVVNDVDVDGYLMGVVAREMYPNWHDEAYRAQAVVARTYSLYIVRTIAAGTHFDLFADTRSQVYGGIAGESAKSRAAVEETRGWVVAYGPPGDERIFKTYYSSCCGGITQSAASAFGEPVFEPLSEQNIGPRCAASPKYSWPDVVVTKREITRRLRQWAMNNKEPSSAIVDVARIDILSNNGFGRPSSFLITDIRGMRYKLGCEDLRFAINTDAPEGSRLFSSFCQPVDEGNAIRFADGHGYGHGVGMCQWCAQQQALAGVPHQQIVLGAFPKAVVVKGY